MKVEIDEAEYEYLKQHHSIMESHVGMARVSLKKGNLELAQSHLIKCCKELDDITIKYCPATARLTGLI